MSLKGGYKIIDLKNNDLTSSNTINGIYDAIEGNYGKPILLSGIVIDSVEKDDIFVNVEVSNSVYVIKAYNRTINITSSDVVTSVEGGNHLYLYSFDMDSGTLEDGVTLPNGNYMSFISNISNLHELTLTEFKELDLDVAVVRGSYEESGNVSDIIKANFNNGTFKSLEDTQDANITIATDISSTPSLEMQIL